MNSLFIGYWIFFIGNFLMSLSKILEFSIVTYVVHFYWFASRYLITNLISE
jgi:hypothetical protein